MDSVTMISRAFRDPVCGGAKRGDLAAEEDCLMSKTAGL